MFELRIHEHVPCKRKKPLLQFKLPYFSHSGPQRLVGTSQLGPENYAICMVEEDLDKDCTRKFRLGEQNANHSANIIFTRCSSKFYFITRWISENDFQPRGGSKSLNSNFLQNH